MILVFGQSGQLATALAKHAGVVCLGRASHDFGAAGEVEKVIAAYNPKAVINAAAYTAVDQAESEPNQANLINADLPKAIAKACAARNLPFVHVSTDYVFDGAGTAAWHPADATNPLNGYGQSKLNGEKEIAAVGGTYAILRTAWVFSGTGDSFVNAMLGLGAARDTLAVVADQTGGPTPASDLACACIKITTKLATNPELSGIYHYAGAPDIHRADFARAIMAEAGLACTITDTTTDNFPTPAMRPLNSRLDCTTLKDAFGISPPDWREGLAAAVSQIKNRTKT